MAQQEDKVKVEIISKELNQFDFNFKIIVIGNSGVGKSCLTLKATEDSFLPDYSSTIGFEFRSFYVKVEDTVIKLSIWDTCGQEIYRSLIRNFYRNSSLAILVYSIDDENSFNDLDSWLNEIRTNGSPDMNIYLIGNKVDLEDQRVISKETAETFAQDNDIKLFLETSAKTGFNAQNLFIEVAKLLYNQHKSINDQNNRLNSLPDLIKLDNEEDNKNNNNNENPDQEKRKKGCC